MGTLAPRRLSWIGLLAAAVLLVAACSSAPERSGADGDGGEGGSAADSTGANASPAGTDSAASPSEDATTDLHVVVTTVKGTELEWDLRCDPDGGDHPNVRQACEFIDLARSWGEDPFAPVPQSRLCAQVHGGDQSATVTGRWVGGDVNSRFDLTDRCEIGRWSNALPVLVLEVPPPAGKDADS